MRNKVPGIVYGAGTPAMIELDHNALFFALKKEAFHSSHPRDGTRRQDRAGAAARLPDAPVQADRAAHRLPARRRDHQGHEEGAAALRQRRELAGRQDRQLPGQPRRHRAATSSAWPRSCPSSSTVDLGELAKGQSLHVNDIKLAAGIKVVTHGKPNPVIVVGLGAGGRGRSRSPHRWSVAPRRAGKTTKAQEDREAEQEVELRDRAPRGCMPSPTSAGLFCARLTSIIATMIRLLVGLGNPGPEYEAHAAQRRLLVRRRGRAQARRRAGARAQLLRPGRARRTAPTGRSGCSSR